MCRISLVIGSIASEPTHGANRIYRHQIEGPPNKYASMKAG